MKVAFMLVCLLFTRFDCGCNTSPSNFDGRAGLKFVVDLYLWCQVERGKQAHYCYDDADLKELVNTFPTNASYHIQRFKGTNI